MKKFEWNIKPLIQGNDVRKNSVYIITNMVTLGVDEKELLDRTESVLNDVTKLERSCRASICKKKSAIVEDQYYKSYGVLRYGRRLELPEALLHINWLMLGADHVKDDEVSLSWEQIHKLVHTVLRRYEEITAKGRKTITVPRERAERVREIVKGDEA